MESNSVCNHASDWQNVDMITDRIWRQEVLLPINYRFPITADCSITLSSYNCTEWFLKNEAANNIWGIFNGFWINQILTDTSYLILVRNLSLALQFQHGNRESCFCYTIWNFSVFVVFLTICNFSLFSSSKGSKIIKILTSRAWNYLLISLLIISLRIPKHKIIPFTSVRKNIWVLDYSCMRNILTVWILIYTDLLLRSVNQVGVLMLTNRKCSLLM